MMLELNSISSILFQETIDKALVKYAQKLMKTGATIRGVVKMGGIS